MNRARNQRASAIYRRCDEIARLKTKIKNLVALNEKDEWLEHCDKTGKVVDFVAFRNQIRYGGGNWYKPKAA